MGVLGGLSPLVITSIDASMEKDGGTSTYGPAWWILAAAVGTVIACAAIRWRYPHCNYTLYTRERRGLAGQEQKSKQEAGGAAA
jgi:hypothetical protein